MLYRRLAATFCSFSAVAASTLPTRPLPYRGVLLDLTAADATDGFAERLAPSLERWRQEGIKSCMLKLPIEAAGLASVAAEEGFVFHHVPLDADGRHVVLKRWLAEGLEDKVPPFATHQVGIAGLCMDSSNRILLVKEWRDQDDGTRVPSAQWKLPGGLLDAGESFAEAAVRETWEETGVNTHFRSLLSFWHRHGLTWGKSDLYYVARLEPASDNEVITACPDEISDCKWMHVDEFLQTQDHPLVTAVLKRVYGLEKGGGEEAMEGGHLSTHLHAPLVEMLEAGVQWPGREPYPTYFASKGDSE
jgi:8-oxo-dGTP pyrophosphatase MutT (NUDIX family)